jgi:hypothetical protein
MNLRIYIEDAAGKTPQQNMVQVTCKTIDFQSEFEVSYKDFDDVLSFTNVSRAERQYNIPLYATNSVKELDIVPPTDGDNQRHDPINIVNASKLLRFLSKHGIDINKLIRSESDKVLVVESNKDFVLSLAWELANTKIRGVKTIRKVMVGNSGTKKVERQNFLFLLSHGFLDGAGGLHKVANYFSTEVSPVLNSLFETNRQGAFKPQLFQVIKYLNQDILARLKFDEYDNIHLVLHGRENGDLGFEAIADHWQISWLSSTEFVKHMQALNTNERELVFLSCCYSGYGTFPQSSLAFQLVNSGIARHAIAFNGQIGSERTLPGFVNNFYANYMLSNDIIAAFHKAVKKLKTDKNPYWDKPVIYVRDFS